MIGKISKGTGFYGVLLYAMDEKKGHYLDSNLRTYNGINAKEFSKQLAQNNDRNSRVKKPVFHVAIALEKGAKVTNEEFKKIGEKYMRKFGFNPDFDPNNPEKGITPYVMVRHTDTTHPHIHIIASRIDSKGYCNNPSNDYKLSNKICRGLEKEFGFRVVPTLGSDIKETKREEMRMRERFAKEGKKVPNYRRMFIAKIDKYTQPVGGGKRTFGSFVKELKKEGITVNLNTDKARTRINGISFSMVRNGETIRYKGSALGKGYTWNALSEKLDVDLRRDLATIQKSAAIKINAGTPVEQMISQKPGNPIIAGSERMDITHKGGRGQYQEEPNKEEQKAKAKRKARRKRGMN